MPLNSMFGTEPLTQRQTLSSEVLFDRLALMGQARSGEIFPALRDGVDFANAAPSSAAGADELRASVWSAAACCRCRTPGPNQSASKLPPLATPVIHYHERSFLINTSLQRGERGPQGQVQPLQRFLGLP